MCTCSRHIAVNSAGELQGLDRATHGLSLEHCQRIQLDMRTEGCIVRLGPMEGHFATFTGCQVTGPVILARLQSLSPQMEQVAMPVGSWHSASVPTPQIGCR